MAGFTFSPHPVTCDGVSPAALAAAEGTPLYVYSAALIVDRYRALDTALGAYPHRVHYALKANSTLGIVRLLQSAGSAVDANSGGEIAVARRAGVAPRDIVFTGVGKTAAELEAAVCIGVGAINAESAGELARIDRIATARGTRARVAVRINPGIEADSHPGIVTGGTEHKFGVPIEDAGAVCRDAAARPGLALVGVHAHVGSQLTALDAVARTASTMARFAQELRDAGVALEHVDLGGGLGISYDGSPALEVTDYARTLVEAVAPTGFARVLHDKWYVDELYDRAIVRPSLALWRACWRIVDAGIIDGAVNGAGRAARLLGWAGGQLQTGRVTTYLVAFMLGALLILGVLS